MTFIREMKDVDYVTSLVQWLGSRISPQGSLQTSTDTAMALQALAKYAAYAKENNVDLSCQVTLSNDRSFKEHVRIKRDNATVLNTIEIMKPGEQIFVSVKGSGTGVLYFNYTYNVKVPDDICKFDIKANFEQNQPSQYEILTRISRSTGNTNSQRKKDVKPDYRMEVCASPNADVPDGMVIFEVGLLTGFKANAMHLEKLVSEKKINTFAISRRKVDIYVPSILRNTTKCIDISLEQEFNVGQLQSGYVKVYAYYEPDFSCERLYMPGETSPLLKFACDDMDVCTCAEGGCPPENPLNRFLKDKNNEFLGEADQRDLLREFACENVDYVWKGRSKRSASKDGFIEATFLIDQVLKPGHEDGLENQIRRIKARDHCGATFNFTDGKPMIIMGKDSTFVEEYFAEKQFMYLIDSSSMVFPAEEENTSRRKRKLVTWFIREFSNETTRCYS
uniref:Putative alpha-macroglobulin posttranslational modification protein n=1 Tax=Hyalomma excavatum TaxID=257692 RepID=A0A131XPI1_9ACAR